MTTQNQLQHGDPKHWTVAAYGGSVTTGEPKFYAIKSASDCVCSEIAEEDTARFMLSACKSADRAIELLKESRETIAACFRVIYSSDECAEMLDKLEIELREAGVRNGIGVRVQDFVAAYEASRQ